AHGRIYVAPPDRHLLLQPGSVRLSRGPRESHHRPAIDPLFRSAARAYGERVIGVILTGALNDGVAGLLSVRAAGGVAVDPDPAAAYNAGMPPTAQQVAGADHVLPAAAIGPLLGELAGRPATERGAGVMPDPLEEMPERVEEDFSAQAQGARRGQVSVFTCPE